MAEWHKLSPYFDKISRVQKIYKFMLRFPRRNYILQHKIPYFRFKSICTIVNLAFFQGAYSTAQSYFKIIVYFQEF